MRLLLDTHVVLWLVAQPELLDAGRRAAIEQADEVRLSAVVGWEVDVKRSTGRLEAPSADELLAALEPLGFEPLDVTWRHAIASAALPWHHRDPFDRLLVAQAAAEGLVLVTDDDTMGAYDVELLPPEDG